MKCANVFGALLACTLMIIPAKASAQEAQAQDSVAVAPVLSPQMIKDVSYLLGVNFGGFLKGYNFGDNLDYYEMLKGIGDYLQARGKMTDPDFGDQFRVDPNKMDDLFNEFLAIRQQIVVQKNREIEIEFLAENALKPGVQVSSSGLQYEIVNEGNEVRAALSDTVFVKYRGVLIDGTVFDETEGDAIPIVLDKVIEGWQEGLPLIGEGGVIFLYVPAKLGYGDEGLMRMNIEPGATLIFVVTLERIGKYVPVEYSDDDYWDWYDEWY